MTMTTSGMAGSVRKNGEPQVGQNPRLDGAAVTRALPMGPVSD